MYIITGGAGFIGSALAAKLNSEGQDEILIVDELGDSEKWKNLVKLRFIDYLHKDEFLKLIYENRLPAPVQVLVHLGACSSTTETNAEYLIQNNYRYTRILADWAIKNGVRFIYASSGATYGDGSQGYSDSDEATPHLQPMNRYGYSKQLFDLWALRSGAIKKITGLKFFNVFGPNEYHKGDMRSVVHKAYQQIQQSGRVKLFKSYKKEYADGEQRRDFIYVKDCTEVIWWLIQNRNINGLFNLGTGKARTWNDLVKAVFDALGKKPAIDYIDLPAEIMNQYQYFTEAQMDKLAKAGNPVRFHSLEDGVKDYVQNYLMKDPYLP